MYYTGSTNKSVPPNKKKVQYNFSLFTEKMLLQVK